MSITDSPIKGVFVRYVQSKGIVVLAFFDVRYAQAAHALLATRTTDLLDVCADDSWFRCRYLTPNQTVQLTGDSKFLKAASAAFYISVQGTDEQDDSSRKRPVDTDTLLQLLESFGTIRSVNLVDSLNDDLVRFYPSPLPPLTLLLSASKTTTSSIVISATPTQPTPPWTGKCFLA